MMAAAKEHLKSWVAKEKEKVPLHRADFKEYVDLTIQFIGAHGLPKMDSIGEADPYFVADLDEKVKFISSVKNNTRAATWNEIWRVKNVPSNAFLSVKVKDKDNDQITDDTIGSFHTHILPSNPPPTHTLKTGDDLDHNIERDEPIKVTRSTSATSDTSIIPASTAEAKLLGKAPFEIKSKVFKASRGEFFLKIESRPSEDQEKAAQDPYLFDGPIRFSRHHSTAVGRLTALNDDRLYTTWKMYLVGASTYLPDLQHWNTEYKAAQRIFSGPASIAVRTGIRAGHKMLYARTSNNGFGVLTSKEDVIHLLQGRTRRSEAEGNAEAPHRVKPAVYTYVISCEDDSFRFSETGAAFFVDFASKHALHSNCCENVRYSGEFHPRPEGGWENFSDSIPDDKVQWELVIDNNSGTYSPDKTKLPNLQKFLKTNFPAFNVIAMDFQDPELKKSTDACKKYALEHRGVRPDELEPNPPAKGSLREEEKSIKNLTSQFNTAVVSGASKLAGMGDPNKSPSPSPEPK